MKHRSTVTVVTGVYHAAMQTLSAVRTLDTLVVGIPHVPSVDCGHPGKGRIGAHGTGLCSLPPRSESEPFRAVQVVGPETG